MTEIHRRIYHVAQQLFAAHGYAGVSIADIAARAKIAKSTVLHHFPNKQKLYQNVVAESIEIFAALPDGIAREENSLAEKLKHLLRLMLAEPVHARLLNRVFMDNPKAAPLAARRYWRPLLARLSPEHDPAVQATAMFCVSAVFQIAFSIELQSEMLGRCNASELAERYAAVIDRLATAETARR